MYELTKYILFCFLLVFCLLQTLPTRDTDSLRNLGYVTFETAIPQCGHIIDHKLFQWRTISWNASEPIYSHKREENVCVCVRWNLTHSPGSSFVCSSLFLGPIKWNHTCRTLHIPRGRCISCRVACVLCYGECSLWVGGPGAGCVNQTPFSSPSDVCSFALNPDSPHWRVNKRRHVWTERSHWSHPRPAEHSTFRKTEGCVLSAVEGDRSDYIPDWEEHTNWPECTQRG